MWPFFSLVLTYAIFGTIGFYLSRRFKPNPARYTWIVLGVAAIFSQWCFVSTRVVDMFTMVIPMNYALQAIFAGILAGLVKREVWGKSK